MLRCCWWMGIDELSGFFCLSVGMEVSESWFLGSFEEFLRLLIKLFGKLSKF
jgi:hypothetical protein